MAAEMSTHVLTVVDTPCIIQPRAKRAHMALRGWSPSDAEINTDYGRRGPET